MRFALAWYDLNRGVFKDSRETHARECAAMLDLRAKSYPASLDATEGAFYEMLGERERAAFRIARDFAMRSERTPEFFIGCDELAERLGCDSRQAHRILKGFAADGALTLVKPGVRRSAGVQPRAAEWKWALADAKSPTNVAPPPPSASP